MVSFKEAGIDIISFDQKKGGVGAGGGGEGYICI